MPQPAAREGDKVLGVDMHVVLIPSPGGPVPTPLPHPFSGSLTGGLSDDVKINGRRAATHQTTAENSPPHLPNGGPFQRPPSNRGTVNVVGGPTVLVNNKPMAKVGDQVVTCGDPADAPTSAITTGSPDVVVS